MANKVVLSPLLGLMSIDGAKVHGQEFGVVVLLDESGMAFDAVLAALTEMRHPFNCWNSDDEKENCLWVYRPSVSAELIRYDTFYGIEPGLGHLQDLVKQSVPSN